MSELSTLPAEQDRIPAERIPLGPSRRRILVTGGVVVVAAAATAACGSSTPEASTTTSAGADPAASPPAASAASTAMEAPTADIAVGGGVIYADKMVVVTQPTAGDFKAFSAVCTHKGCTVAKVADGVITCACHGSQFSIEDGSVTTGPASSPLPAVPMTVEGDKVVVA
jgi:Rieske Fe-S protein